MKIVVCVNHVPDTASKIKPGSDGKTIESSDITYVLNPYDEFAVEAGLQLKEAGNADEVIIVSAGDDSKKESIRKALAMGGDSGVLIKCENNRDSLGIAKALADEIKELKPELVFFGKQSVDYDNMVVGQMTAELLDYNSVSLVSKLEIIDDKIIAEREIEGGKSTVETKLPAVLTTQKGMNEPRYPALKGIMAAKKKTIVEKEAAEYENILEVVGMKKPPEKSPGKIIGTDSSAVPELVKLLKEEAKII